MSVLTQENDPFEVENFSPTALEKLQFEVQIVESMIVADQEGYDELMSLYRRSKDWENRIEFMRKEANAPFQAEINSNNDGAKKFMAPIKEIQRLAKKKTEQYFAFLESEKKKEEERAKEAADLIGFDDLPYIPPVEKSIRGDGALAFTRTIRKFRIVDREKIPQKYLMVNEEAVALDIKLGVAEIPGIEIYEEKVVQLKAR